MSVFLRYSDDDTLAQLGVWGVPDAVQLPALRVAVVLQVTHSLRFVRLHQGPWEEAPGGQVSYWRGAHPRGYSHSCPRACFFLHPFLSPADEAQEAEAIQILTSILTIREATSDRAPQKTIFVLKILAMLYYLMMDSSKASCSRKAAHLSFIYLIIRGPT